MAKIRQTHAYHRWFDELRDRDAQMRILIRIRRLSLGNFGDVAPVGGGVSELRIDYGPGYRVYFRPLDRAVIVLLTGGTKRTQRGDIRRAKQLSRYLKET